MVRDYEIEKTKKCEVVDVAEKVRKDWIGIRDGRSTGPWDHWSEKKIEFPENITQGRIKIVIIYEWINV